MAQCFWLLERCSRIPDSIDTSVGPKSAADKKENRKGNSGAVGDFYCILFSGIFMSCIIVTSAL